MDEENISRRSLLAAAAGAIGTTVLPSQNGGYEGALRDARGTPEVFNVRAFGAKGDGRNG